MYLKYFIPFFLLSARHAKAQVVHETNYENGHDYEHYDAVDYY